MKVRLATYTDVTRIVIFAGKQHAESSFAHIDFNPSLFRRNLREIIRGANSDALIAVNPAGEIKGLLLAWCEPLLWTHKWYATDLHTVAEQGGDMLIRAFKKWAKEKGCFEIGMGTFNGEDEERIERLYNRLGFETVGKTYRMEL